MLRDEIARASPLGPEHGTGPSGSAWAARGNIPMALGACIRVRWTIHSAFLPIKMNRCPKALDGAGRSALMCSVVGKNALKSWATVVDCGDVPLTYLDNDYALAQLTKGHKVRGHENDLLCGLYYQCPRESSRGMM